MYYGSTENVTKVDGSNIYMQQQELISFVSVESCVNQVSLMAWLHNFF